MLFYGVSHIGRGGGRWRQSGDFGSEYVGLIHALQWDWHLGGETMFVLRLNTYTI